MACTHALAGWRTLTTHLDRHDATSFKHIAMVRSSRLAGAVLRSRRAGRNGINPGGQLLCAAAAAGMGAAGLVVRAGVDGAVRDDGGVGVVGVAAVGDGLARVWR